jgi:hypothetical protein
MLLSVGGQQPTFGEKCRRKKDTNEKPAAACAGRVKVLPSGKDNGWTEEFRRLAAPFARSLPREAGFDAALKRIATLKAVGPKI